MIEFVKKEHRVIAELLRSMDCETLLRTNCWFGGGTAVVMKLGEYRRSLDVDFLCADVDGYRELRSRIVRDGAPALFRGHVEALREFRADQYGIRAVLGVKDQAIKFEIIREGRIELRGSFDADLQVPVLFTPDLMAEKLLANADRGQDPSTNCRDAFDLGMLIGKHGSLDRESLEKASKAYGEDIRRKFVWSAAKLQSPLELKKAADALEMPLDLAQTAASALMREVDRLWPDLSSQTSDP